MVAFIFLSYCSLVRWHLHPITFQDVQTEGAATSPRPETPGTPTEMEGDMEGALLEVDLDGYQTTLEEVLTWLLSAEDALQMQEDVSDDVEEVKDQFHTHEVWEHTLLGWGLPREN